MTTRTITRATLLASALLLGCGSEDRPVETATAAGAVEAREQNTVELDGIRYRVKIFRQLNPRIAPDRVLYDGARPGGDSGIFAAFIEACNVSEEVRRPTRRVSLQDAFGDSYPRLEAASPTEYGYDAVRLRPDECLPPNDSVADRAFPGAALLFSIPFDRLGNRPFALELRDNGVRRIELDV